MEGLKKGILVRNGVCVGAVGDKYFSNAPIGVIQAFSGQTAPHGYLLCNGTSYKVADYPDLYAVIGNIYGGDTENFNVPDYRETVLVGVGENTTDTIADHDVYELGEFKDDQFQGHEHNTYKNYESNATGGSGGDTSYGGIVQTPGIVSDGTNGEPRKSTTTHGKQKGVTYIIKAFHTNEGVDSGVSDDVVEYVDNKISSNLGEKVDYKVVVEDVEDGNRYVEDIVTQDINTWLPNDNSSILINLKKTNGINYLNFQLLCNKKDSKNWSCIVNGAANELWKIRYIDGVRYIEELATMDKVESKYSEENVLTSTDWNTLNTKARYYFSGGTPMTNSPEGVPFGLLEVINVGSYCRIQRYFAFNGKLYIRRWSGNSWNEWYRFDGIAI